MSQSRVLLFRGDADVDDVVDTVMATDGSVVTVDDAAAAMDWLDRAEFDCIVGATHSPTDGTLSFLERVLEEHPTTSSLLYAEQIPKTARSRARQAGITNCIEHDGTAAETALQTAINDVLGVTSDTGHVTPDRTVADPTAHAPVADEIAEAVDQAPVGITITDPTLPDNPIVYLNDAYEHLTGYDAEELLGRNIRLLQGPETDPEDAAKLDQAMDAEESISVEMRNYRADGSAFWNRITLAPIYDTDGELSYFIGFQEDVSARREAEERARRRASSLYEEQQRLDQGHTRITTVLESVSYAITNASDRETLLTDVRAAVDAGDEYVAGWIARTDHSRGDPIATVVDAHEQLTAGTDLRLDTDGPVAEAFQNGSVVRAQSEALSDPIAPEAYNATTLLAVPLVYRTTVHGVLGVYIDPIELTAIDREETLLASIGRLVGRGLVALRTRQSLHADSVIVLEFDVTDPTSTLAQMASTLDSTITYERFDTHIDEDRRLHVAVENPPDDITSCLDSVSMVQSVETVVDCNGGAIVSTVVNRLPLVETLTANGLALQSLEATPSGASFEVTAPPDTEVRQIINLLEADFEDAELRSQRERNRSGRDPGEFVAAARRELTDRQYAALETAYESGYFEWPRPVEGDELADSMGITRQTFHQHLRTAERKLFEAFFET